MNYQEHRDQVESIVQKEFNKFVTSFIESSLSEEDRSALYDTFKYAYILGFKDALKGELDKKSKRVQQCQ